MSTAPVGRGLATGSRWFVGVVARKQTYRNLLYLLLAFPFGVAYFAFLVTGFATSMALAIVLIGIPLLVVVMFLVTELTAIERTLAVVLLDVDIPASEPPADTRERLRRLAFDLGTWKGLVYLFSKFVIGIGIFIVVVFGLCLTYALVTAPLHYQNTAVGIHIAGTLELIPHFTYDHGGWTVGVASPVTLTIADGELISVYADSLSDALMVSVVGVLVGLITLHLFNGLAWLYAKYTHLMLRRTQPSILRELDQ